MCVFFGCFLTFYIYILCVCVVEKNIGIHSHNYIIYFNDKSRGELFTLSSCRRDNMEKREREGDRERDSHARTHTHARLDCNVCNCYHSLMVE